MFMISKLLSHHAKHFTWFISINPHNNPTMIIGTSIIPFFQRKGPGLKEVKYLDQSHASIVGIESRLFDSRTNTLEDTVLRFLRWEIINRKTHQFPYRWH